LKSIFRKKFLPIGYDNLNNNNWKKFLFQFIIAGASQFVVLTIIAMLFYPGGTQIDPSTIGYSFFLNYFSDLGNTITYSGESNLPSLILFSISLTIFSLSYSFFFIISWQKRERKSDKFLYTLGFIFTIISTISFIGVVFTPSNIYPTEHNLFAASAFLWALIPFITYTIMIFRTSNYSSKHAIPFIFFIFALVSYIIAYLIGPEGNTIEGLMLQVTIQKIVMYLWCLSLIIGSFKNLKIESK